MKDVALLVLGSLLTWLLGGAWGHRQQLQRIRDQVDLYHSMPPGWVHERAQIDVATRLDIRSYLRARSIEYRQLVVAYALIYPGVLTVIVTQLSFMPGDDQAKGIVALAGATLTFAGFVVLGRLVWKQHTEIRADARANRVAKEAREAAEDPPPRPPLGNV